jgi:hypothetical protein
MMQHPPGFEYDGDPDDPLDGMFNAYAEWVESLIPPQWRGGATPVGDSDTGLRTRALADGELIRIHNGRAYVADTFALLADMSSPTVVLMCNKCGERPVGLIRASLMRAVTYAICSECIVYPEASAALDPVGAKARELGLLLKHLREDHWRGQTRQQTEYAVDALLRTIADLHLKEHNLRDLI